MAFKCDNGVTVRGLQFVDCSAARTEAQHSSVGGGGGFWEV